MAKAASSIAPRPTAEHGSPPRSAGGSKPSASTPSGSSGLAKKGPKLDSMNAAMTWLLDRVDIERISPSRIAADTLKLDRMQRLVDLLGEPHRATRFVHVAGTKGKGSTCEMTAACLEACGYTVGLYTSPHLMDVRERIRINRRPIPQAEFIRIAQRVADAAANLPDKAGEPTFFELMTAMGFVHFADEAVDVAVVEVGLGGRLDSTNVITPDVTAITSISLDHTQILGKTVEQIAREKAGIFKPGVPAITVPQVEPVMAVLRECAANIVGENGHSKGSAPLMVLGKDIDFAARFEAAGPLGPHHRVTVSSPRNEFDHLAVPLKGEYQAVNCGLALALIDRLSERGFKTPANKVTQGLGTVALAGRFEIARSKPTMVLDGAHNADSAKCLMKALAAHVQYDALVVIFGCAADKDIDGMLRELALAADKVIFTKVPGSARAADPQDLQRRLSDLGKISQTAPDIAAAMLLAGKSVSREDLICVTGSIYLVAEVKKYLESAAAGKR